MQLILVIDDETVVRANLSLLLEAEGFRVIQAENGHVGLDYARRHHPDLIICDVTMPGIDGYTVLSQLRQDSATATIPFIFLTGRADQSGMRQGMNLGADDYLSKPFTRAELMQAISTRLVKQAAFAKVYAAQVEQIQQKLNSLMLYDNLTGLPNREILRQRYDELIKDLSPGSRLGLLTLSIDRYNRVTDMLGLDVAENLVKHLCDRLTSAISDEAMMARWQGSQFIILLSDYDEEAAVKLAQTIISLVAPPFKLETHELFVTISVGIAFYPTAAEAFERVLQCATAALSQARQTGGDGYLLFSPAMVKTNARQIILETDLRYAIERGELRAYYQPQVDARLGRVVGAEALIRWQHPERGLVPPGQFIPIAEETNLIVPLSDWITRTACQEALGWQSLGYGELRVAVNLSARQLTQMDLPASIDKILQEVGLKPHLLELEITESSLMQDVDLAIQILSELKELGVRLALDDFGTGYSSLIQLKRFSFDTLKIDQGFVSGLTESSDNSAIIQAIIEMARHLNTRVIAEGVETEEQLKYLLRYHCDELQGYFFSHPLPPLDFKEWLKGDLGFNKYLEAQI